MQIGLNVFWNKYELQKNSQIMLSSGAKLDFAVCHLNVIDKTMDRACEIAEDISDTFKEYGIAYIANFEQANFAKECRGEDGFEWANHPDGTHRMVFPERLMKALDKNHNLIGVIYDEFEHMIANRNAGISLNANLNVFTLPETASVVDDGEKLKRDLRSYVTDIGRTGVKQFAGEHVFPILYHIFASCGITPNFKSQKESFSNIQHAIAAGAAYEYDLELWNCVDMWFMRTHPGHSAKEMYNNMVFAYESGVTKMYVESSAAMVTDDEINELGKEFIRFTQEYHGKKRAFGVSDLRPDIGIIRYDDTYWGQSGILLWKRILFGDDRLKPNKKHREYLRVFHMLTHGESCANGINWGRLTPWSLKKHRSFAGMNSTLVFDENVKKEKLESLKLCFLCGEYISPETLEAVHALVKDNGLTVITTARFLPASLKKRYIFPVRVIQEGKGQWIVVKSFRSLRLKRLIRRWLGNPHELTLRFSDHESTFRISKNGEELTPV
ncbi:MAG: hypothetical protein IKJ65_11025 [Clostridia bacterium]|nr:hypothetical protein [Clostridia bacterium]